jgi:gp16 family phage-associated protein
MKKPEHKDRDAFLAALDEAELTVADWAREKKLPLTHVYQVLQGRMVGRRGTARQVIKAMGLPLPARRSTEDRKPVAA